MDEQYSEVGARIREARLARGITQEKLSEMCGKNASYIGQIERGEKCPSMRTLAAISASLGITPYSLLAAPEGERDRAVQLLLDTIADCPSEVINEVTLHAQVVVEVFKRRSGESTSQEPVCSPGNGESPENSV